MSPCDLDVKETLYQIDLLLHNALKRRFIFIPDLDDLRQDVFVTVIVGAEQYDARRASWPTFLATLIQSEIHRFRLKKRWFKHTTCESIHDLEEEDHPLTNNYLASELNDIERAVFLDEVRQAVHELPDELQLLCRLLFYSSKAQIADQLGLEARLLSQKIKKIRKLLTDSKIIRDYL
jgi:RNA polymerase sigma factor (sigma-70 family)